MLEVNSDMDLPSRKFDTNVSKSDCLNKAKLPPYLQPQYAISSIQFNFTGSLLTCEEVSKSDSFFKIDEVP